MNKNENYYAILGITHDATDKEVKKSFYKLSFLLHPDHNKDADISKFNLAKEAYDILYSKESRDEYDMKSRYGKNYNEYFELFDINVDFSYDDGKEKLETFRRNEVNNVQIEVDDDFNGSIEYERWVKCKKCEGSGKDLSSKIVIRDLEGNVVKIFDSEDGCDYCEGLGKDYTGANCHFCQGQGKIGINPCDPCKGNGRIMGRQKLSGIKLNGNELKMDTMGHFSKNGIGYLLIVKKI